MSVQLLIRITGRGRATHTHTPTHSPRLTILFAFFTASRTSRFSGGFEGRPIVGLGPRGFFFDAAAARSCLGAIPPVLLRAVCLVRAMLFQSLRATLSHPLHTPRLFLYSRRGSPASARLPRPPYSPAATAGSSEKEMNWLLRNSRFFIEAVGPFTKVFFSVGPFTVFLSW